MTRDDAERLLREHTDGLCARLRIRADGTVMTADCPIGVRVRLARVVAVLVGAGLGLSMPFWLSRLMELFSRSGHVTMGMISR
jgi:hypothetical protein